jgi:membrane protein required for colicin V production
MNILDIFLAIPLLIGAYSGYKKGLIVELASLAALILGIYAAINFSYFAAEFLNKNFSLAEKYVNIFAFILTFIAVVFLIYMLGRIIEKIVNIVMLGFLNRLAGMFFGIIKWAFIISVLIYIINMFDDDNKLIKPQYQEGSMLYEPISTFAPYIIPKLNIKQLQEYTKPVIDEIEDVI